MKPITKQFSKKAAFTIVELLTVMSTIIILIGLLVPSLSMAKRYAQEIRQKTQFHSIEAAMELFSNDWGGYPPSDAEDETEAAYCGAMKLCEAMIGQDLIGFHPYSRFRRDCTIDGTPATNLYATPINNFDPPEDDPDNLKLRKTYLQLENVNAYRLWHLYGANLGTSFSGGNGPYLFVLGDVYKRTKNRETGKKIGMPILYYKANPSNTIHDPNWSKGFPVTNDDKDFIYNYLDNDELVKLGPGTHPLLDPATFYEKTRDKRIDICRPYRPDSYILISAGFDGMYGTDDDIYNFEK